MGSQIIIPYRGEEYYTKDLKVSGELGQILFLVMWSSQYFTVYIVPKCLEVDHLSGNLWKPESMESEYGQENTTKPTEFRKIYHGNVSSWVRAVLWTFVIMSVVKLILQILKMKTCSEELHYSVSSFRACTEIHTWADCPENWIFKQCLENWFNLLNRLESTVDLKCWICCYSHPQSGMQMAALTFCLWMDMWIYTVSRKKVNP